MKKYWRILPVLLIISILCTSLGFTSYARDISYDASAGEFVVYVSPDGDDNGDGTPENMLKTPAGAQAYVRNSGVLKKRPVRVVFKPGNYYLDKGLVFQSVDAGTAECPVVWEAEEKGTAHFFGTSVLDNSLFEPVTDQEILKRIPESAQDKVLQLDLKKMNIDIGPPMIYSVSNDGKEIPYVDLFYNGREQMISRWPNGECNYAFWDKVITKQVSTTWSTHYQYSETGGGVIEFTNPRLLRWTTADQAYIRGHTQNTYACSNFLVKSVDTEKKTITMKSTAQFSFSNSSPKELQIFNLMEEIDCATEWFVDSNTDILYYYPPKAITADDVIEITTFQDKNMIEFSKNVDMHMTLKGLDISRTRGRAIYLAASNVTVDNCIMTYSKTRYAVKIQSDVFEFTNNYIAMCDGSAIGITMSENLVNDRTAKRSEISGNYITQCGNLMTNDGHAISADIRHANMNNNTIHNMNSGASIGTPADSNFKYNEIYNFGKDITDVGAYYVGTANSGQALDVDIEYNFLYDYGPVNQNLDTAVQGIYFDDGNCFSSGRYNIFYGGARSSFQVGGGDHNTVEKNIILNMGGENLSTDSRRETWATAQTQYDNTVNGLTGSSSITKHYFKQDPYLNGYLSIPYHLSPIDNVIRNNLSDKPFKFNASMEKYGVVYNNMVVDNYTHFVDPDNYDFRLKDDSPYAKVIPELTESNFDIWSVGAPLEVTEGVDRSFDLLHPTPDGVYNSAADILIWSKANMADEYRVVVATDKEMKNVLVDEVVPYNYLSVQDKDFEEGKEYWWMVEAINKSFKRKSTVVSGPHKFTNTINYISSVDTIKQTVESNEKIIDGYDLEYYGKEEYVKFKEANRNAMKTYENALKTGVILKTDYDDTMYALDKALDDLDYSEQLKFTHLTPEDFINTDIWLSNTPVIKTVREDQKGIYFARDKNNANVMLDKEIPQNDMIQFRAKIDFNPNVTSSYITFDLRRQNHTKVGWNDSLAVMFFIKRETLEFQIYPREGLIMELPNTWVKDGEWHDYAVGVINKSDGARMILMIDGEMVIDYRYYGGLMTIPGKFAMYTANLKGVELEESQLGVLETNPSIKNYFVGNAAHSEEGLWTKSEHPGFRGSFVKQIASGSGSASWNIEGIQGTKKIYFRKIVAADGDKNAKLEVYSNKVSGQEGDEVTLTYDIDMSSGEDEWILIDDGRFASGVLDIKLTGSGNGTLYANAIRVE